jgi:rod shape determining protein RodA
VHRRDLQIDWLTVGLYLFFVLFGWVNIYAASSKDTSISIFNIDYNYGKQFIFILISLVVAFVILTVDTKFTEFVSYAVFGLTIVGLLVVLVIGRNVNGAKGWIDLGPFKLQPAEFAKIGVIMALARFMSRYNFNFKKSTDQLGMAAIIAVPALLIMLQPDDGSTMVFAALMLMFYREGLAPFYLVFIGLCMVVGISSLLVNEWVLVGSIIFGGMLSWYLLFRRRQVAWHLVFVGFYCALALSVDFLVHEVLKPHQQKRVIAYINPSTDPHGIGYNVIQSKIAIGSGGFVGKGFLEGTQTKFDFVPMQDTDFIFCTIGEEYGWIGSTLLLVLYFVFLTRVLFLAESTRTRYGRVLGYCIASIMFFHIAVNVGMALGFAPVVGIPLPFFSYGGSSLLAFTVLVFLLLNHYANRVNVLSTERRHY